MTAGELAAARGPVLPIRLEHLGQSGLRIVLDGAALAVDPPAAVDDPLVVTWTERERTDGARLSPGPLAAAPEVLRWLRRPGIAIGREPLSFGGFQLLCRPFRPIPYATPPEALRKIGSALRSPRRAIARVSFALARPAGPPLLLVLERSGRRLALLQQALHRFVTPGELSALVAWVGPVDIAVAGTDYDDEEATGRMLGAFGARTTIIADLTGPIRRTLGLPVRPLDVALRAAPKRTLLLRPAEALELRG